MSTHPLFEGLLAHKALGLPTLTLTATNTTAEQKGRGEASFKEQGLTKTVVEFDENTRITKIHFNTEELWNHVMKETNTEETES